MLSLATLLVVVTAASTAISETVAGLLLFSGELSFSDLLLYGGLWRNVK